MIADIVKIFIPTIFSFTFGILITPAITNFLYRHKMWKKKAGKIDMTGKTAEVFNSLHQETEIKTPRLGGIIIWLSVFVTVAVIWLLARLTGISAFEKLDFLSRDQTWIPLSTLVLGAFIGLIDDIMEIRGSALSLQGGLSLRHRLLLIATIGLLCGYWFFDKLDVHAIGLPWGGFWEIGWLIIPLFALVMMFVYASGVIDGIDGLAGGVFAAIFTAYAGVAFYQGQINLAAFSTVVVGGILAFLWFNIPPARFYMSETGSMALTITLTVIAFMTDKLGDGYGLFVLPLIAFPLFATVMSNIIQILSKKFRNGKKVFRIAPIHHHFEAIGWPSYKVTMRYWIISVICAIVGMSLALAHW